MDFDNFDQLIDKLTDLQQSPISGDVKTLIKETLGLLEIVHTNNNQDNFKIIPISKSQ